MSFLNFLFGKGEKSKEYHPYTPQQEQAMSQLLSGGQRQLPQAFDFLSQLLSQDPEQLRQFEAPALRQFEETIVPGIAERFTGQFGSGSHRSSAFGQQLGKAGAALAENLASQRGQLGLQGVSQLQNLLSGGLGQQTYQQIRPAQPGLLQGLAGSGSNLGLLKIFGLI